MTRFDFLRPLPPPRRGTISHVSVRARLPAPESPPAPVEPPYDWQQVDDPLLVDTP